MLLEGSLGFCGGCLPSGSFLHSPSPGRVPWRGCRCANVVFATAFGRRLYRIIRIRADGGGGCWARYVGVVKIRDKETKVLFEEPLLSGPSLFPLVLDSDGAVFGTKASNPSDDMDAINNNVDVLADGEGAEMVVTDRAVVIIVVVVTFSIIVIIIVIIVVVVAIVVIAVIVTVVAVAPMASIITVAIFISTVAATLVGMRGCDGYVAVSG